MIEAKTSQDLVDYVAATKKTGSSPLLVMFGGSWCQPCKAFKPSVVKATDELKLTSIYYDVDIGPVKKPLPTVHGVPALVLVRRGKVVKTNTGSMSSALLTSWLRDALRSTSGRKTRG